MDKYMEQARKDLDESPSGISALIDFALKSRASEIRLLDLLRRAVTELAYVQESPTFELCQTSEGALIVKEGSSLLAQYKDVK